MKQSNKKQIGLFILYGALTVFVLALILSLNDIEEIFKAIAKANIGYVSLAVLCILIYMALYPLTLCILSKANGSNANTLTTYSIGMIEHFLNGITPFATGGQPFQVYALSKVGVKPSESTSLLLMNFFVFMISTNSYALCALFFFKRFITDGALKIIAIIGFSMNFLVLIFTLIIATNKRCTRLFSAFFKLLCKIKLIGKFLSPRLPELDGYFENVQNAFSRLIKKKKAFFLCLVTKLVTMGFYYATTIFILLALNVNVEVKDTFFIICGTSFAITMVVFVPTPGSSGGIEFAFKTVFASIAAGAAATVAYGGMLIWRVLSFYLVMLISLIFYFIFEYKISKKHDINLNN